MECSMRKRGRRKKGVKEGELGRIDLLVFWRDGDY